jgi:hypothetical protein
MGFLSPERIVVPNDGPSAVVSNGLFCGWHAPCVQRSRYRERSVMMMKTLAIELSRPRDPAAMRTSKIVPPM